ncbi:MAG TPA: NAD(P)H-dependent glycerol-3-phosphate dehydrogenase [Polyangiaceae bacterium]|nr:NAD(P)H-dependent glycerol-3-phosphate dehydrogenase [Polyangiaceae bacterium]
MTKVAVLGAGAWGTALAKVIAEGGSEVRLWTWESEHADAMRRDRQNARFLEGVPLPPAVAPTSDVAGALAGVDRVIAALPSHALRDTLERVAPLLPAGALWVSATKGIENTSLMTMSEVALDVLGPECRDRLLVLSGPSFAREVVGKTPTNLVVAGSVGSPAAAVQSWLSTDWLRVYVSSDPIGVEIGGALKNVIAIAVGACEGLGFGHNTRAALITRGLAEMTRLAVAKGGDARTLSGLSGLGDLVLTCTGELSRNRTVGVEMGRGRPLADVLRDLGHVAEGVATARSGYELGQRLGVDLPITNQVYHVLHEQKSLARAVRDVLARPLKSEWE